MNKRDWFCELEIFEVLKGSVLMLLMGFACAACQEAEKEAGSGTREELGLKVTEVFSGIELHGVEVRSYEVGVEKLREVEFANRDDGSVDDPFADADDGDLAGEDDSLEGFDWLGPVVNEAGFGSRFFKRVTELRDCSKRVADMIGDADLKAEAFYDVKGERLIVKGGRGVHQVIRFAIAAEMVEQIRSTLAVYEVPGVRLEDRSGFWDVVPADATLLREVSWVGVSGGPAMVRTAQGEIVVESEIHWDAYEGYVDTRLTVGVELPDSGFSYETGFYGVTGVRWAQEVGSLNGETTLMLVSHYDPVLANGERWADWIQKEEGGSFLEEERLDMIRYRELGMGVVKDERGELTQVFVIPPTFLTFLETAQDGGVSVGDDNDPFADKDEPVDDDAGRRFGISARTLLEENGISFREGDFVSYLKGSSTLVAKLSPENMELLDGIINTVKGLDPPEYSYLEFSLMEGEDFREGTILKRMVLPSSPGVSVKMRLGEDLAVEAEMQIAWQHDLMEIRATLTEQEGDLDRASFQTGITVEVGQAVVIQETEVDGKHRSWVVTGRVKVLEKEIDALLKGRKRK